MATNGLDGANGEERGIFLLARKVGNGLERVIEVPVFILSVLMTGIVLLGVFFRYVVRAPLGWSEELSRYLMIWMALLSVALCIWRHEHVGVTMAIKKFPRLIAKALIFVSNGMVMYFLFVLTKYDSGWRKAERRSFPRPSIRPWSGGLWRSPPAHFSA